jgi:hypothetical protein
MSTSTVVIHWVFLIGALVVLPLTYVIVLAWLSRAYVARPPRLEVFVAFGTLGGWLLTCALSPSPLSLPCAAFTFFVSFPASLFFLFRLMSRREPQSRYHRFALAALCCGLLVPVLVTGVAFVLDPK